MVTSLFFVFTNKETIPEIAVHAGVNRKVILVEVGPVGVDPSSADFGRLLEDDDLEGV